jgi:DNA-binding transcriptional MerR regulator
MTGAERIQRPRWSVGALAKVTGLTVRTLHHYDELGLLRPSERTPAGHRRYTEPDLQRLYQIRLLRQLGMSLDEINAVLADPGPLSEVLDSHLKRLDDEAWRLNALRRQTRDLLEQLNGSRKSDSGNLLALRGCTGIFDEYLTKDQRLSLDEQAEGLGEDTRKWLEAEWPLVLSQLVEHYRADDPVDGPEVRRTAVRLLEVSRAFTGGDPELVASMRHFFREHGVGVLQDVLVGQQVSELGDGLWDYVGRACAAVPAR